MSLLFFTAFVCQAWIPPLRPSPVKQLLDQQHYTEAYRLLTAMNHTHSSTECYSRVQCLVALEQWTLAWTECEAMLPRFKTGQWWTLASDIAMALHQYPQALACLEEAREWSRECVGMDMSEEGEEALDRREQRVYQGMLRNRPRKIDPFSLPYDVLSTLLSHLPLKSLARCSRVSRHWRAALLDIPSLWQKLQFSCDEVSCREKTPSRTSPRVSALTLQAYLGRLDTRTLTHFSLSHQLKHGDVLLRVLAPHVHSLHSLDLNEVTCTPTLLFSLLNSATQLQVLRWGGLSVKLNAILQQVTQCRHLRSLDVHDCFAGEDVFQRGLPSMATPSLSLPLTLQSLSLSGIHGLTAERLAAILHQCPRLEQLELQRSLVDVSILNLLNDCCPLLTRVIYRRHRYFEPPTHQPLPSARKRTTLKTLVKTRELALTEAWGLTDALLHSLLHPPTLHLLCLEGNPQLSDTALDFSSFPLLHTLNLRNCHGITEAGLLRVLKGAPRLRALDLSGLSAVTEAVLRQLCGLPLVSLHLSNCSQVTDTGIVAVLDALHPQLQCLVLENTPLAATTLNYSMCKIKQGFI
ncbi:hypothetical protein BDF14DRAFT_1884676 [Spinellus fusiger]|nr:hypothetical protein BDF14DRAFT_1884676 [Spinellus fusiger]